MENLTRIFLVFIHFIFIIISFKSGLNYLTRFQTPPSEKIERLEFVQLILVLKLIYNKQKPNMLDYLGCMHFKGGNSHSKIERCTSDNDSDIYRGELWLCWAARDIWLTVRDIYYWRGNDIWLCFYHWLRFLLWKLLSHAQWATVYVFKCYR